MPVAAQAPSRTAAAERRILTLVRWMKFVEKVVLGLWVGFIAANVAILASALPYIYTQEDSIRCGSLGITNFAINMIPAAMLAVLRLEIICYTGRTCISATIRWKRLPVVGSIVGVGAFAGGLLWVSGAFAGLTVFAWYLEWLTILAQNPPPLPPNLSDMKACSQFIGEASKPPNFDLFEVWLRILRR
jgi:hypothetical protein